jgi:superfamily II DNA or RNA helicase
MQLRPYQLECLQAIVAAARRQVWRQLVVLPTGAGKTVVFAHLPRILKMRRRLLVLAHREELLRQAADKFLAVDPDLRVGIEQAGSRAHDSDQVVVASVPSLAHPSGRRLQRFEPQDFSVVVCDEAHHSTARTYHKVFEHFRAGQPDGPLLIGVTATPTRGDRVGLKAVYDEVVFERSMVQLMVANPSDPHSPYLCRIRAWRVETGSDLSGVHIVHGDFVAAELSAHVNTPNRNELVVRCYQERCPQGRALAFCVDVQHSLDMAAMFQRHGIPVGTITGQTPRQERAHLLERFHRGEVRVLTNCNVLTEGFDEPRIECLLMARPTQSSLLYLQMLGRGTRLCDLCMQAECEHKPFLSVVDLVDDGRRVSCSASSLVGLPLKWNAKGNDLLRDAKEFEALASTCPDDLRQAVSLDDARRLMHEYHLLGDPRLLQEIAQETSLAWFSLPNGDLHLSLGPDTVLRLHHSKERGWVVTVQTGNVSNIVGQFSTRKAALADCEGWVRRCYPELLGVVDLEATWRVTPATDKQRNWLSRIGHWRDGISKGDASRLLDAWNVRQRL